MTHKIIVFGNSGSGKSTLAIKMAKQRQLTHLDLDTLAWLPTEPPRRASLADSHNKLDDFIANNQAWVIEGCYADLLSHVAPFADQAVFMNLSVQQCQQNAQNRPWEPHKYESKASQDSNLPMLLNWIADYESRNDAFSLAAHQALYHDFPGNKQQITTNQI